MSLYRNKWVLMLITFALAFMSIVVLLEVDNGGRDLNSITGHDVWTHVELLPAASKNCSVHLYPGWNMVSFYCLGMYNATDSALASISGSYGAIFEYNSNDASDPWKSYNPELPNWTVQQADHMDRVSGYWIYMYNDSDMSYPGVYSDSVISLYPGWNLIGYPSLVNTSINSTLNNISFTVIKYYYNPGDSWLIYTDGSTNNTLNAFETYKGYWINVSGYGQWNVYRI